MASKQEQTVHGLVLSSQPLREYDKRLSILTLEYGKITVWANGSKKPGSPLMAGSRNFVFGEFRVREGRQGYQLHGIRMIESFSQISSDLVNACYGSYLLELSNYLTEENMEAEGLVNLLYFSLRAILKEQLPNELVRRVFELRALYYHGEYTENPPKKASDSCIYAWKYVLASELRKLYNFSLTEQVLREFSENVDLLLREVLPYRFKSLEILESIR